MCLKLLVFAILISENMSIKLREFDQNPLKKITIDFFRIPHVIFGIR